MKIVCVGKRKTLLIVFASIVLFAAVFCLNAFSPAVLVKRADALLKRSSGQPLSGEEVKRGLVIDNDAFTAYIDGTALELTLKEFELLSYLYENAGRVLTRDQLRLFRRLANR